MSDDHVKPLWLNEQHADVLLEILRQALKEVQGCEVRVIGSDVDDDDLQEAERELARLHMIVQSLMIDCANLYHSNEVAELKVADHEKH